MALGDNRRKIKVDSEDRLWAELRGGRGWKPWVCGKRVRVWEAGQALGFWVWGRRAGLCV